MGHDCVWEVDPLFVMMLIDAWIRLWDLTNPIDRQGGIVDPVGLARNIAGAFMAFGVTCLPGFSYFLKNHRSDLKSQTFGHLLLFGLTAMMVSLSFGILTAVPFSVRDHETAQFLVDGYIPYLHGVAVLGLAIAGTSLCVWLTEWFTQRRVVDLILLTLHCLLVFPWLYRMTVWHWQWIDHLHGEIAKL